MSTVIQTELPDDVLRQAQALVDKGWANSIQELVAESLRRYLESHSDAIAAQHLHEDVTWALQGHD